MEVNKMNPMHLFPKIPGKAVVVFSGGQDSTTCLYWALRVFDEVEAVTFFYQQRHHLEVEAAKQLAKNAGVRHHLLDVSVMNQLAPSSLTREEVPVLSAEEARERLSKGELPSTFVPGRNMVFLTFAGILARQVGAKHIVTGVCETDFSGYPDCRDMFVKSLNVTVNLAMEESFVIHTPLMWLDKKATWKMADDLGVLDIIKNQTLTCYNGIMGDGCGTCPSCYLRRRGYEEYMESKHGTDCERV